MKQLTLIEEKHQPKNFEKGESVQSTLKYHVSCVATCQANLCIKNAVANGPPESLQVNSNTRTQ